MARLRKRLKKKGTKVTPAVEHRISEASSKLTRLAVSGRMERKRDAAYIRSTKALDPSTRVRTDKAGKALRPQAG